MKIKKEIRTLWLVVPAVLWTVLSCNVLDTEPFESYDEVTVWGSKATADAFVNGTINNVMSGYINAEQMKWEERTNNSVFNNGASYYGPSGFVRDEIDRYDASGGLGGFYNIRQCNLIIEKAKEYGGKGLSEDESRELVAKGKFLRAAQYYLQARTMGRFVWVDKVLSPADTTANGLALPTTKSTTESYTYLIKDLQEAIPDLPETAASGDISRDAGNAFLSEIALQGAAYEPDQTKKREWLRLVVSAVNDIHSTLASDYGSIFTEQDRYSSELIFCIYRNKANTETQDIAPLQNVMPNTNNDNLIRGGYGPLFQTNGGQPFIGWLWWAPSQNLIDEYEVIDENTQQGVRWNESTQFTSNVTISSSAPNWTTEGEVSNVIFSGAVNGDVSVSDLMYKNRDARFQGSIVHDDDTWWNEEIRLTVNGNLWRKANGGLGPHMGTTGYYFRKGVYNVAPRIFAGTPTDYHYVVTRYGRALLNKAEAILWLAGMGEGNFSDAVTVCNQTRTVHGKLPSANASTLEDAWKLYQRERRVELVLENDYYWSLLRWGKHGGPANYGVAPSGKIQELITSPTYIEIAHDRKSFYVGTVTHGNVQTRSFREERRYLLPIPQGQIDRNPNLGPQNPGW
ncbi:MAG: RagB/SusD family nutrient uptake outer membrane protein [Tannerella sp.]|jgi:hypothetical protein|nr:RagB/SusD family nutrient uptake outer membrane protein [Tannerella sp.]